MSVIDLTQLRLREQTKPGYITEGAAYTGSAGNLKMDNNIILVGDFLKQLQSAANVPAYDNAALYSASRMDTVKVNGELYIASFSGSPDEFSGVPPPNDTYWTKISIGWIAHNANRDQYLDLGGPNQISAAEIRERLNCACLQYAKVTLTPSQVQNGNSSPVALLPGVANKMYVPMFIILSNDFDETSPGDTPYSGTWNSVTVKINGQSNDIFQATDFLKKTQLSFVQMQRSEGPTLEDRTQLYPGESLNFYVPNGNPTGGTHGLTFHIYYTQIKLIL